MSCAKRINFGIRRDWGSATFPLDMPPTVIRNVGKLFLVDRNRRVRIDLCNGSGVFANVFDFQKDIKSTRIDGGLAASKSSVGYKQVSALAFDERIYIDAGSNSGNKGKQSNRASPPQHSSFSAGNPTFKVSYYIGLKFLLLGGCWCVLTGGWWWAVGGLLPFVIALLIHPCAPFRYGQCPEGIVAFVFDDPFSMLPHSLGISA